MIGSTIFVEQFRADGHRFFFYVDSDTVSIKKAIISILRQAQDPTNELDYSGARTAIDGILDMRNHIQRRGNWR
jgi:hypothetical protein